MGRNLLKMKLKLREFNGNTSKILKILACNSILSLSFDFPFHTHSHQIFCRIELKGLPKTEFKSLLAIEKDLSIFDVWLTTNCGPSETNK